jgi:hypothetical protein
MPKDCAASRLIMGLSTDGDRVAECELAPDESGQLPGLTEEARRGGAVRLWVHCPGDLSGFGLTRCEGYRRFFASVCPAGEPLPVADAETVADLWPRAFRGQWGHKRVDPDTARAMASSGEAVFVGLRENGQWTALCRVEPAERLIDGPGFANRPRTPDAVRRLVLAACAYLGVGPVTVETWGEPAGPYLALGLELVEDGGGWERVLPVKSGPLRSVG